MAEGFWLGLGLIGALGAAIPVVFLQGSGRMSARVDEKDCANHDDTWVKPGDMEERVEWDERHHRMPYHDMGVVERTWKGLAVDNNPNLQSEGYDQDYVISDVQTANDESVREDLADDDGNQKWQW